MNTALDNFLVGAVLVASLGYALVRLGPRSLRQRILRLLSLILTAAPSFLKLESLAQRLSAASGKSQAACGGCNGCGSGSSSAPPPTEINVPVGKIGRRS